MQREPAGVPGSEPGPAGLAGDTGWHRGRLTLTYASTIAHTGTFRLYLTEQGYDPSKPLTWSDLPEQPFAEVTDPPLRDGGVPRERHAADGPDGA